MRFLPEQYSCWTALGLSYRSSGTTGTSTANTSATKSSSPNPNKERAPLAPQCKLQMQPPSLPYSPQLRKASDCVITFVPSSPSLSTPIFHPRVHPGQDLSLVYPPLAGKHLVVEPGRRCSEADVMVARKSSRAAGEWKRAIEEAVRFGVSPRPPPSPPPPSNDATCPFSPASSGQNVGHGAPSTRQQSYPAALLGGERRPFFGPGPFSPQAVLRPERDASIAPSPSSGDFSPAPGSASSRGPSPYLSEYYGSSPGSLPPQSRATLPPRRRSSTAAWAVRPHSVALLVAPAVGKQRVARLGVGLPQRAAAAAEGDELAGSWGVSGRGNPL
ncbi:hypothetical protein JCM10207_000911 [Rhodosporidiobolus poonsookiae]